MSGAGASGSATASGRAGMIGAGTLQGSAEGVFTSETCVVFSGTALLTGKDGSITPAAHEAHACAEEPVANVVSFSGRATVIGGTSAAVDARRTLPFTGTYDRQSGFVTISFGGRISYG